MNYVQTMNTISERSQIDWQTCEAIIKSYERYCERNLTRTSSKNMQAITSFIVEDSSVDMRQTETVMTELFVVLKEQIKKKVPFLK
ncbi:hypothetical protein [Enterococcus sp. LJL51]|uniref:hypothetical protein n=1 Tax=Enterococcus sp. LJL51 TaxID=3416656 RepID=UPI003CE6A946